MLQHVEPVVKFSKLIIVEPMISAGGTHHLHTLRSKLAYGASRRQYRWTSREEACKRLMQRRAKKWDPRILQAFMVCSIFLLKCITLLMGSDRIMLFIGTQKRNISLFRAL